jgi:hypothetical protein
MSASSADTVALLFFIIRQTFVLSCPGMPGFVITMRSLIAHDG